MSFKFQWTDKITDSKKSIGLKDGFENTRKLRKHETKASVFYILGSSEINIFIAFKQRYRDKKYIMEPYLQIKTIKVEKYSTLILFKDPLVNSNNVTPGNVFCVDVYPKKITPLSL